jgi:hypothetical protein
MSGCLDNVHCECPFEWRDKRNAVAAIVSGILFFSGWWIIIDVAATYPNDDQNGFLHAYYTCGVLSTVSMFMINAVSNSQVRGEAMTEGVMGTRGARLWLLLGFVVGFGSLIASVWILFGAFVVSGAPNQWRGAALFLQNFLIFISSLVYKFGRTEDLWG